MSNLLMTKVALVYHQIMFCKNLYDKLLLIIKQVNRSNIQIYLLVL